MLADNWPAEVQERFFRTIREELSAEVHGEVDEKSWHLKQALVRRQTNVRKETKLFRDYARQSFEDTLTCTCTAHVATSTWKPARGRCPAAICAAAWSCWCRCSPARGYAVLPEQLKGR